MTMKAMQPQIGSPVSTELLDDIIDNTNAIRR